MTQQKPLKLKEEKRQINFLLKDLYFARTINIDEQNPYSFAIVEFATKTKVYDVITNETYLPVKKINAFAIKKAGEKLAYNIMPLTKALKIAGVTKADTLLTKENVAMIQSQIAKHLQTNHPYTELGR